MQFSGKIGQIIGWRPPLGLAPPPLGNPGSATDKGSRSLCLRHKTWGSFLFRFPQQSHTLLNVYVNEDSTSSPATHTFFVFHSGYSLRCLCHLLSLTFHLLSCIVICISFCISITRVFHGLNSLVNKTLHVSLYIRAYFYRTF